MKGILFTELLEMVESDLGPEVADAVIVASKVPGGGAYTAVGTYPHEEIVALVVELARRTAMPIPDLLRQFGRHLFQRFVVLYPAFFPPGGDTFTFLESVETRIHVEVLKLYPDAELPRFECLRDGEDRLRMIYRSRRALSAVAEGLVAGCAAHFGEEVTVVTRDLSGGAGTEVELSLVRAGRA